MLASPMAYAIFSFKINVSCLPQMKKKEYISLLYFGCNALVASQALYPGSRVVEGSLCSENIYSGDFDDMFEQLIECTDTHNYHLLPYCFSIPML